MASDRLSPPETGFRSVPPWVTAFGGDPAAAELALLHVVRVKGVLRESQIPHRESVQDLAARGFLVEGRAGCALTAKGTERHAVLLKEFYRGRNLASVDADYAVFAKANPLVEDVCVTWQLSSRDLAAAHAGHDVLAALLGDVRQALDHMALVAVHISGYLGRLDHALHAVDRGDTDYLTSPLVDSFHQVWSELHQDLLVTLERERESDRP
jgi:hypothetical protein